MISRQLSDHSSTPSVTGISQGWLVWGERSQNAPRFCLFINAGSPWFTASQDQISSMIGSLALLSDSICRRTGSQHYRERVNNETKEIKTNEQTSFPNPLPWVRSKVTRFLPIS